MSEVREEATIAKEVFITEPRADRGPRAGSQRGVVVATGSSTQPAIDNFGKKTLSTWLSANIQSLPLLVL